METKTIDQLYQYPPAKWEVGRGGSITKVTGIEVTNEILVHIEGARFPMRGLPTGEALVANSILKKVIIESLKLTKIFKLSFLSFIFSPVKFSQKVIDGFNVIGWTAMYSYVLKVEHQSLFTKTFKLFIWKLFVNLGIEINSAERFAIIISHIFYYDMAYQFRLQDLFTATNSETLQESPRKEINRLLNLVIERDLDGRKVSNKFKLASKLLSFMLLLPRVRNAFRKTLSFIDYSKLCFDEGDTYWALARTDYNFFGKTLSERAIIAKDKGWTYPKTYDEGFKNEAPDQKPSAI